MAIDKSITDLQAAAMKESLKAAELLLPLGVSERKPQFLYIFRGETQSFNNERYGYPAAILLLTFIEAVGHIKLKSSNSEKTFRVLREPIFGNQQITKEACDNLYKLFRNRLIHNHALPECTFLTFSAENNETFYVSSGGYQNKDAITKINLYNLLGLCKKALNTLLSEGLQEESLSDALKMKVNDSIQPPSKGEPSGFTSVFEDSAKNNVPKL